MKIARIVYDVFYVDAWAEEEGTWTYNETSHVTTFASSSADIGRAAKRALSRLGVIFERNKTVTEYDPNGNCWEILEKKTRRPIFYIVEEI